jgi:protein associated with RNAse G/E
MGKDIYFSWYYYCNICSIYFLKSETYKKMCINLKLKQIDSDDIEESKMAQFFCKTRRSIYSNS